MIGSIANTIAVRAISPLFTRRILLESNTVNYLKEKSRENTPSHIPWDVIIQIQQLSYSQAFCRYLATPTLLLDTLYLLHSVISSKNSEMIWIVDSLLWNILETCVTMYENGEGLVLF
jgi:hypothetical protein